MTAKRFTIKPQDDYFGVTDNYSADKVNVVNGIRTEIEAEWLCELLNELYEENKKLHDEIFRLRTELAYDRTVNDGKDWFKVEDEHLKWKKW